jgi:putative restriction endonuclease
VKVLQGHYPGSVIGIADGDVRRAVFAWLTEQREELGEALTRDVLTSFSIDGRRIPLVGPQGIWKPAACELPISIATIAGGPYEDAYDEAAGVLKYAYRGIDPGHVDNQGLRRAMRERVPLVYFVRIEPGLYAAQYPVFIVGDDPGLLRFDVQVDDIKSTLITIDMPYSIPEDNVDARRAYVTRTVRQRVHQVVFRERVIRAYQQRCALCLLRHQELLDAAHITPDKDPEGEPVVSNGVALCKLHHAAFDRLFFAIRPDYMVEVKPSILRESDGPMLVVGLQQIHQKQIYLPRHLTDRPDPIRLERRYREFQQAS